MTTTLLITAFSLAFAQSDFAQSETKASSIVNKDTKKYALDITCDGMTSHQTISPKATLAEVVSAGCVVKIAAKDGPSHTLKGDKDLVITDGKFSE